MSKIINVGRVTSYADAVAGGYTGTREEWEIVLANLGTTAAEVEANRQAVAEDKAAVEGDVTTVEEYKDAAAQSASEAAQSAASAHTDALAATAAKEAAQTAQGIAVEAKEAAAASKTAAESAQSEADTSASAAAGSALVAQNAAATATTQAGAASDSATAAAASAAAAAESARTLTIDTTLTQAGQAADAKKVGDAVTDLKSAITPILSPSINLLNPSENVPDTYVKQNNGERAPYSGWTTSGFMPITNNIRYVVLWLNNGVYAHAKGQNLYWAIYNANKSYITGSVGDNISSTNTNTSYLRVSCPTSYFNKMMVVTTAESSGIIIEDDYVEYGDSTERLAVDVDNLKSAIKYTPQSLEDSQKTQARANIDAAGLDEVTKEYQITDFATYGSLNNGYYWNITTTTAVMTNLSGADWIASEPIAVNVGDILKIRGDQGATHKTRIWVLTDDDLTIVSMAQDYYSTTEKFYTDTVIVPPGATKLVMASRIRGDYPYIRLWRKMTAFDILDSKILDGKKLSLLGDSISAYAGTIPDGNVAYYTGSNSGVSSPDQMWWKVLCDKTGMTPLVINGWSGSGINWQSGSHGTHVPMSDDSRCNGLHSGTTMPDVILIAGGVNDYTYAEYAQNEPLAWDGISVPTYTEPTSGKIVYNSFTEAYVAMVKKLQTNYPNAIVVALSTWFTMRGTDNGYTLTHTVGQNVYTQQMYNDKIRYVAEQMHIPYIDVSNIGFNRNNFYPTYAIDSSSIPTHPNAAGQAVMGKAIAEKLIELVGGYFG